MKPLPKPLPCPVCRETPSVWPTSTDMPKPVVVECLGEKAAQHTDHWVYAQGRTDREAINRWNRMVKR